MNYIQILYLCILKQLITFCPSTIASCELHSNLVSLHSETTAFWCLRRRGELWITFKSCIFAFWNNKCKKRFRDKRVVNYIQILYLCILKQQICNFIKSTQSCELHSNLVSLHSETTQDMYTSSSSSLWITFKSCIFAFWNNILWQEIRMLEVVNYIQILYLCILKQRVSTKTFAVEGCELHSNLVSLHSETTQW